MLAFAAIALLSVLLNWTNIPKIGSNFGKVKYYLYAALGIFPVGAWLKTVSDRTKTRLVRTFAIVVFASGLWCTWQVLVMGLNRADPLTETMRYSYGTTLVLLLWLGMVLRADDFKSWMPKSWSWLGITGLTLSMIFVQSRGAQGAFLLGLPFVVFFWKKKAGLAVFALCGFLMGGIAWNYFYGTTNTSSLKILNPSNNGSDNIRRTQWQSGLIAFKEKPILGWGLGNLHTQVKRIKVENNLGAQDYVGHAHNVLIEVAAGTGILGLFFFVGAFLTWMWECWKRGGATRAIMMPFFVAIMFEAQFEVILDANNATWIGFLYAVTFAVQKRYQLIFS